MPAKRRTPKRRRPDQPTIDSLLAGRPIECTPAAREELVNAVYFRNPELPPEAEARGIALLAQWRAAAGHPAADRAVRPNFERIRPKLFGGASASDIGVKRG